MLVVKMIALILSLGMDTLIVSISLGFMNRESKWKIALTFACAETLMPLIGLLTGKIAGEFIGHWASLIGGLALIGVAIWLIFFEDEDEEEKKLERPLIGWALVFTALSIALDELAVGFSIGLIGIPIVLTIVLIALQAFIFTVIGLTFGSKLKPYFGEWSERLAGIVLGLLGIWIFIEAIITLVQG